MPRPVIAFLSDFGTHDHYVGAMKGAALGLCPDATLVDITHEIAPHDVAGGAYELAAAYRYFPHGTIFVAVVDPGVGSMRRGIAMDAGDYRFVAPDNGILTPVVDAHPPRRVVELSERKYARPTVSRTFEGRDRFAPAAAWLAKGVELTALGRPAGALHRLDLPRPTSAPGALAGEVVRVDRFGNLITNIDRQTFDRASDGPVDVTLDTAAGVVAVARVVATYAEIADGEVAALFGSTDHLEFAANGASAAARLAAARGAAVRVARRT